MRGRLANLRVNEVGPHVLGVLFAVILIAASVAGGGDVPWETAAFTAIFAVLTLCALCLTGFMAVNRLAAGLALLCVV